MSIFDNLDLLRAFATIVDSGSISAAARKLRMTQPTLSRQLQTLEAESGTALLRRDTHRMSLTEAGQQILIDAQALLSMAEECESRLRNAHVALSGKIRVFSTIDFGQTVVSRLISSFIQANPAVRVELGYSNRPLHMIEEGCDAGILAGSLRDERVVSRHLGDITRCVVGSASLLKDHKKPGKPEDLGSFPWVALSGSQFGNPKLMTLHSGTQNCTLDLEPVFLTEGGASIREAVRMGLGVAVLPEWFVEEDLLSGRMVRLLPKWHAKPWAAQIVYPSQRRMPERVKAFVEFSTQYMATVLKPKSK
ncbi:LysR family transcriptional regulator [Paraburkholderia phytofirmans]|uniref:LysR family transcriptional regulator n=1 Tax=Paraburkholderia phytofirmans TaxID=261302 RepID=UPI0038BBAA4A